MFAMKGERKEGNVGVRKASFQSWVDTLFRYLEILCAFGSYDQLTSSISRIYKKNLCEGDDTYFLPFFSYSACLSLCSALKAVREEAETVDILAQSIYTANTERYVWDFSSLLF